jgi:hypothetical protein
MSNLLTCLITENLINYLNFVNSYIELKSGIYKLCIKKISDENLIWENIKLLLDYTIIDNISSLNDYNEQLFNFASQFDKIGLNITIYVDLLLFDNVNNIVSNLKQYKDVHLISSKIIKYNKFNFIKTDILLSNIKLQNCTTEMCQNCLTMLFSNDQYFNSVKNNSLYQYDNSIIIDENNIVLDGKYKVMLLKFISNQNQTISCIKLKDVFSNRQQFKIDNLSDFLNIKYNQLLDYLSFKYKIDVYVVNNIISKEFKDIFNTHMENWINSL